MNLLERYPVNISHHSFVGYYFFLGWETDYDRGHVILAKGRNAILQAWKRVLVEHPSAIPTGFWDIKVVAPTTKMLEIDANRRYLNDVHMFRTLLGCMLKSPFHGKKLPKGLSWCKKNKKDEYESHYDCEKCFDGVLIEGHTAEALFENEVLRNRVDSSFEAKRPVKPSVAQQPKSGKPLYAIIDKHGHHASGTVWQEINNWESDESWIPPDTRLFFQGTELKIPKEVLDSVRKIAKEEAALESEAQKRWQSEKDLRHEQALKEVDQIMRLINPGR